MGQSVAACEDSSSLFFTPTVQVHMWGKKRSQADGFLEEVEENINDMTWEFQTLK